MRPEIEKAPDEAPPRAARGPERVFAGLLAAFGLAFLAVLPPCQAPDETTHFPRASAVARGHLRPRLILDGWGGDDVDQDVIRVVYQFTPFGGAPSKKVTADDFRLSLTAPSAPGATVPSHFAGSNTYLFVAYLPQALGIALAKAAGLGPLPVFYAARLVNLAFAVFLVYWAIRITPAYKYAFGAIALVPVSVQQMASLSPDASVIGGSLLLAAVILRLALGDGPPASRKTLAGLVTLTTFLALVKFPNALIGLTFAAVPVARVGSRGRQVVVGLLMLAACVGAAGLTTRASKPYSPASRVVRFPHDAAPSYRVSFEKQKRYILDHKLKYIKNCLSTCAAHGKIWIEHLTILGTLDTRVDALSAELFLLLLAAVLVLDQPGQVPLPRGMKAAALAGLAGATGLLFTALYLWHSAVGAPRVEGIQGRYFLPMMPLVLLLLHSRSSGARADPRTLLAVASAGCGAILIVSLGAIVQRYYLPDPARALAPSNLLAVALPAALACGLLLARPARAAAPAIV